MLTIVSKNALLRDLNVIHDIALIISVAAHPAFPQWMEYVGLVCEYNLPVIWRWVRVTPQVRELTYEFKSCKRRSLSQVTLWPVPPISSFKQPEHRRSVRIFQEPPSVCHWVGQGESIAASGKSRLNSQTGSVFLQIQISSGCAGKYRGTRGWY